MMSQFKCRLEQAGIFKFVLLLLMLHSNSGFAQLQEMNKIKHALPAIRDSILYVDALNRLAMLSHLRFRDSCLIYATTARKIAVRLDYQKGIADAMNCQGIYYMSDNNYLSTKLYHDALKIYQDLGDASNEVQLLTNIGVLMFVSSNKEEALRYIYKANDKSRSLKNDSIRSIIFTDIIAMDKNLSGRAKNALYQKGLAIAKRHKDTRMIVSFENNQGTILYNLGQKEKGLAILLRSLQKADSIGCEYIKVASYMTLGEMMLDMGKEKEAVEYYKKGMESSAHFGYPERYLMLAERLYNFYKSRNMPEQAYEYASLLLTKQQQMSEDHKKSGYSYLNFVLQENEVEQLKKDQNFRTVLVVLMSALLVLILIVLFFVYYALVNKKKLLSLEKTLKDAAEQRSADLESTASFKKMLISVMAHDVRQPLASIVMLSRVFNTPEFLSEQEKQEMMAELENISSQTMAFMNGLLSWIKSRKANSKIVMTVLPLKAVLREANSFFRHQQNANNISLTLDINQDDVIVAHEQMILFVFRNILNNATKYAPQGGKIMVTQSRNDQFITIAFADNGPGLTAEQIEGLFKTDKNNSDSESAGLALRISYDMVRKMKGEIRVESGPLGGATFFVSLPLTAPTAEISKSMEEAAGKRSVMF